MKMEDLVVVWVDWNTALGYIPDGKMSQQSHPRREETSGSPNFMSRQSHPPQDL